MTIRTYTSPQSFKQALEQRLRMAARGGSVLARSDNSWCSIAFWRAL